MYTKKNYSFWMTFSWSKRPFIIGFLYSLAITTLAYFTDKMLFVPWQATSVIGIAVAFYLGFKNNSSYDRTWEARKIYGGLVNNSRTLGAAVVSFIQGPKEDEIKKELLYRHIAWLTALRYQLRLSREWEHKDERLNNLFNSVICEDYNNKLESELSKLLSLNEIKGLKDKSNLATQIMKIQAKRFQELKDEGLFEDFRHMEFHHLVQSFYEDQGKAERIKNFPFPRQYASTALWLTVVFSAFVPFGLLEGFSQTNEVLFWFCPFFSALIIWIFFLMEKIGDYSENPFEGTYNDVPITAITRGIEIDLREMINDSDIPKPTVSENGFLM